jgi:hypothetical protein
MIKIVIKIQDKGNDSKVRSYTNKWGSTLKEDALAEGVEKMLTWYFKEIKKLAEVK